MYNPFLKAFELDLKLYKNLETAIQNLNDDLEEIEQKLTSVKCANPTSYNFGGSDFNSVENNRVCLMQEKECKAEQLRKNEKIYFRIKAALKILNKDELKLFNLYYRDDINMEKIGNILYCDKSKVSKDLRKIVEKMAEYTFGKI